MNNSRSRSLTTAFITLRTIQILLIIAIIFLEIVEFASFDQFYEDQGFPPSAYFNGKITTSTIDENKVYFNGVKLFSYMVLFLSLADSGIYISHCYMGPTKRDIYVNAFFKVLWLINSIVNLYPAFKGYKFACTPTANRAVNRECRSKAMIISISWINSVLFSLTALIALILWKTRQERFEGERRVEALDEVVYKYQPRPDITVHIDKPKQVMIFNKNKNEKKEAKETSNNFKRKYSYSSKSEGDLFG